MALQETLEKSAHFVFFKSTDINLEPDLSGKWLERNSRTTKENTTLALASLPNSNCN